MYIGVQFIQFTMRPIIRYVIAGGSIAAGIVLIGVGLGFGILPLIAGGVILIAVGGAVGFLGGVGTPNASVQLSSILPRRI